MSEQDKDKETASREQQKTTITIAEKPAGDPDDDKDTITVAEKSGE